MQITFNGEVRDIPERSTIAELLASFQLAPKFVAVEVNREVVSRPLHASHVLQAGDEVEVVTLVGGG